MATPVPKTKAEELVLELSDLSIRGVVLNVFTTNKYLKNIEQLLKSGVDVANLWMCKGFVYSLSNQPDEMVNAFLNAQRLGATDSVSLFNQASQFILYGYYDEALNGFSANLDEESQKQFVRLGLSTFNYNLIDQLVKLPKTVEEINRRKGRLSDLGINVSLAKKLMDNFFDLLRSERIRFGLVRHEIIEDEYILFFEAVTDHQITQKVLKEFDTIISKDDELLEISQKISIVLTPVSNIFKAVAA